MVLPSKVCEDSFSKNKLLISGQKLFGGKKIYREVVLNRRTNNAIMSRFGKSFINDKCIFQLPVGLI